MKRTPVQSSHIVSMGHDKSSSILEVEFTSGSIWQYQPVTEHAYLEMQKSDSVGKFFHANIKNNDSLTATKL